MLGIADTGASYTWTFGDGSTAQGKVLSHTYTKGGTYDVTLTVTTASGEVMVADSSVLVAGPQVLAYNPAAKAFVAYVAGTGTTLAAVTSLDGREIQLGGEGTVASVSRNHLSSLRGSDDFTIDFSMQADKAGSIGELFRLHGSFIASVNASGNLSFQLFGASGEKVTLAASGIKVADGKQHDISIQLDDGVLSILVDGKIAATTGFADTIPTSGSWDLVFGNPWGHQNFQGDLSSFSIKVDSDSYPSSPATAIVESDDGWTVPKDEGQTSEPVLGNGETATDSGTHNDPQSGSDTAGASDHGVDLLSGGMALDIDDLAGSKKLIGAQLVTHASEAVIVFDGDQDYVALGRQVEYEDSDRIAFSVDFTRDGDMAGGERLVWNHLKMGLTLVNDGLSVQVATKEGGLMNFDAKGLGLDDTDQHNVTVMLDADTDRLQVLLDGAVVMDINNVDFDVVGAGGREWGWSLGTAWNSFFEGEVSAFHLTDDFDFLNNYVADTYAVLS